MGRVPPPPPRMNETICIALMKNAVTVVMIIAIGNKTPISCMYVLTAVSSG